MVELRQLEHVDGLDKAVGVVAWVLVGKQHVVDTVQVGKLFEGDNLILVADNQGLEVDSNHRERPYYFVGHDSVM